MLSSRVIFIVALCMLVLFTSSATSEYTDGLYSSRKDMNHVLDQYNSRSPMTCNKFPRICRAKGSPGPDCCRKKCVDVMIDNLNCGECGRRCKYGQACCGGECLNIRYDPKNCGGCKNRCNKGSFCKYGMCSYA